ncbi:n-carbamoylputrescine amidase [Nannochloropsis oceanica]
MASTNKSTTPVKVAATQFAASMKLAENLIKGEALVREAARQGAKIILLQELFAGPYFCQEMTSGFLAWAEPVEESVVVKRFQALAAELQVVLPVSFYERAGNAYYNSVAMVDADGTLLGVYRKSHIPDSPGYFEKFYFTPGDSGFRVWKTRYAKLGVGICWDQWFPETARCLALQGAELLLFPTAIGSEPQDGAIDSRAHWRRVMQGHAGANMTPVIASNRVGVETPFSQDPGSACVRDSSITFYGNSFITDETGAILADANDHSEAVLVVAFDLAKIRQARASWGMFRDRRPALYKPLLTKDGILIAPLWKEIHNTY